MAFRGIRAYAENFETCFVELRELIANRASLGGATRRSVFGVEIQQYPLTTLVSKVMRFSILVWEREIRSEIMRV